MTDGLHPDDPIRLGPYRLLGRLGAGGMGQVYLGCDDSGRQAAVKVVHPGLGGDPRFRDAFAREIATAMRVRAPWTAAVLGSDPHADRPWLASEYVPGPTLEDAVVATGPLPEVAVITLAGRLAEALAGLHAIGVAHRDLKPSNVLLATDGPRLIDFGIAAAADSAVAGRYQGTPAYMSPEQALGHAAVPASDVFSLASVLVFAATGFGPFGRTATPVAMLMRIADREPELAAVPPLLRALLAPCLAKDPAARPSSSEFALRCIPPPGRISPREWLPPDAATLVQRRSGVPAPLGADDPTAGVPTEQTTNVVPASQPRRWRPWAAVGGAAAVAAAVVGAMVVPAMVRGSVATESPPPVTAPPTEARQLARIAVGDAPESTAVSADGTRAFTANRDDVSVVDTVTGGVIRTIGFTSAARGVAVSPDGGRLFVGQQSGFVIVVDPATGGVIATVPVATQPQDLVMSPDGRVVYSFGLDGTVTAIDTASNKVVGPVPVPPADGRYMAVTPDSRSIWVYAFGDPSPTFAVLDAATRRTTATIETRHAEAMAFAPDGTRAYAAGGIINGAVSVVEVPSGRAIGEIGTADDWTADVVVSRGGRHLFVAASHDVAGGADVQVLDVGTGQEVQRLPLGVPLRGVDLALSADGTRLVVATEDDDALFVFDVGRYVE